MLPPILTAHLFPEVADKLLSLLRSLDPPDWDRQTIAPQWKVRHVAAHLLDTQLRKLTMVRDGFMPAPPTIKSNADFVQFINQLNADGVAFYSRLSPAVLISLMETTSRQSSEFHQSLDPYAKSTFSVSWAGESESLNWFDTARELTEHWHHQQQIRLATNRPGLMEPHLYHPVLDCFMRALPHAYRNTPAPAGTQIEIHITGDSGGTWHLYREQDRWRLIGSPEATPTTTAKVTVPQEIAWRIFTKGIARSEAISASTLQGQHDLAQHFFSTLAIVG